MTDLNDLNELAKKSMEDREEELSPATDELEAPADEDTEDPETAGEEDVEEDVDEEVDDEEQEEETGEEEAPEPEMIEIVVDGEARMVPLSDVVEAGKRTFQKETASDKRLEEATELLKKAKASQPPVDEGVDDPIEVAKKNVAEKRRAYNQTIVDADDEAMDDALAAYEAAQFELVKATTANQTAQVKFDYIMDRLKTPVDDGGFEDVMSDQYAIIVAERKVSEAIAGGADKFDYNVYAKAAKETRDIFFPMEKEAEEPSDFEAKREKKSKIINIKTTEKATPSSIAKRKQKTRDQLNKEGLDFLKKARGQED